MTPEQPTSRDAPWFLPGRLGRWRRRLDLDDPRHLLRLWALGRLLLLLEWAAMLFTLGDTRYYWDKISRLGEVGPQLTMPEYPTPVLWLLRVPWLVSFGHRWAYVAAFFVMMFALDAAFSLSLWRLGGRLRGPALAFWAAFVPLVGTTAYLRFDIVTAVLAGWALLAMRRGRSGLAGFLVGLGAAVKLWPALLLPALLGGRRGSGVRRSRLFAAGGLLLAGVLTAGPSLLWAGWDRLLSPLGWQGARGLQIESVWATVPMVLRLLHPHRYWVAVSEFNAWEISGPTTHVLLAMASVGTALGLGLAMLGFLLWLRRGDQRPVEGAALMLLVVLVMIVTNKTFSPQYIIWVGGPLAAGWAVADERDGAPQQDTDRRHLAVVSRLTLLLTLLTQLVYPIGYASLVGNRPGMAVATTVLVVRNGLLVWLLVRVASWIAGFLPRRTVSPPEPDTTTTPAGAPEATPRTVGAHPAAAMPPGSGSR